MLYQNLKAIGEEFSEISVLIDRYIYIFIYIDSKTDCFTLYRTEIYNIRKFKFLLWCGNAKRSMLILKRVFTQVLSLSSEFIMRYNTEKVLYR
jgi:hypothetical protein